MDSLERAAAAAGLVAPAVAGVAILLAALVAPPGAFSPTTGALSDLGVAAGSGPLFNGGLVLAGALALPFAWWLWTTAERRLQRAGAATLAASFLALAGVGLFPSGTPYHVPAAIAFYLLFTYGLFLHGSGTARAGYVDRGLVTVWLAVAHVTAWLLWAVAGEAAGLLGLAAPETAGALVLGAWSVRTASRGRRRGR